MKRANLERNLVVVLFILVLVVFSFADRASKRYLQNELSDSIVPLKKEKNLASLPQPQRTNVMEAR